MVRKEMMCMGNPIVSVEFLAHDFQRLKAFYSQLFGWEIGEPNEWDWAEIRTGSERGAQAAMVKVDTESTKPRGTFFYVEVEDLETTLKRAEEMGAKTVVEPWEEVGLAVFLDPEGNRVGLLKQRR